MNFELILNKKQKNKLTKIIEKNILILYSDKKWFKAIIAIVFVAINYLVAEPFIKIFNAFKLEHVGSSYKAQIIMGMCFSVLILLLVFLLFWMLIKEKNNFYTIISNNVKCVVYDSKDICMENGDYFIKYEDKCIFFRDGKMLLDTEEGIKSNKYSCFAVLLFYDMPVFVATPILDERYSGLTYMELEKLSEKITYDNADEINIERCIEDIQQAMYSNNA